MIECAHAHAKARIHWQKTTDQFWWSTLRSISCHDFLFFFIKFACIKNKWRQIFIGWFPAQKKLLSLYRAIAFATSSLQLFFFFGRKKSDLMGKYLFLIDFFYVEKFRVNRIFMVMWLCRTNVWCLLVLARSCK